MQIADLILIITRFDNTNRVCVSVLERCCRYAACYLHRIASNCDLGLQTTHGGVNLEVEVDVEVSIVMEVVRQQVI